MSLARVRAFERTIEADLDWRTAELAIVRELVTASHLNEIKRSALYRAAWTLLYAHYEGFSKFCLDNYIEFLCKMCGDCVGLSDKTFVFLFEKEIKKAKSLSSYDSYRYFRDGLAGMRNGKPSPRGVDTQSNLWPNVLVEILQCLNIEDVEIEERKLKTLVARRNDIAHGKQVFVQDSATYLEYENVVLNLMYRLALKLCEEIEKIA